MQLDQSPTSPHLLGRLLHRLSGVVPPRVRSQLDAYAQALRLVREIDNPAVLRSMGPSAVRGLFLHRGTQGVPTPMPASHTAHFDWTYPADQPEMALLYRRAKEGQWDGDSLPWDTDVDPLNPERPLIPREFLPIDDLVGLSPAEERKLGYCLATWMLSQFLHGEQGALFAAAQVTEAVQFFDGKLYGSTQVMDEGRHVEVFNRYLDSKLNRLYQINDNLFVIIDALMSDGRWDMKFLGMQIMVEGLALGAFTTLYQQTQEPLLKELLKSVIQDEARHVHYGVVALREHFTKALTETERREREDWAFEVALLMRDRFQATEIYDEWFVGLFPRSRWREIVDRAPGMRHFRTVMFSRLVPNLRAIGLMTPRIMPRYEQAGLMQYFDGKAAPDLRAEDLLQAA